jgi:hypothetical protein
VGAARARQPAHQQAEQLGAQLWDGDRPAPPVASRRTDTTRRAVVGSLRSIAASFCRRGAALYLRPDRWNVEGRDRVVAAVVVRGLRRTSDRPELHGPATGEDAPQIPESPCRR